VISRAAIAARATEWGLTEEVVEKDYVLGWLLWGSAQSLEWTPGWFPGFFVGFCRVMAIASPSSSTCWRAALRRGVRGYGRCR
jgi:hypothetical protein